jgi:DNA-binding MarR family transcriptional regulator
MSISQPASVEDLLNFRLSRLLASSGSMVTLLCEGRYGITRREWRLVCILAEHGALSPSALAQHAHLERARVSRHVADMVHKKVVVRVSVEGDRRRALLELTQRGRKLHSELFPESVRFNNLVLQALSPAELAAFDTALARLTEAADRISKSHALPEKADRRHGGSRRFAPAAGSELGRALGPDTSCS